MDKLVFSSTYISFYDELIVDAVAICFVQSAFGEVKFTGFIFQANDRKKCFLEIGNGLFATYVYRSCSWLVLLVQHWNNGDLNWHQSNF